MADEGSGPDSSFAAPGRLRRQPRRARGLRRKRLRRSRRRLWWTRSAARRSTRISSSATLAVNGRISNPAPGSTACSTAPGRSKKRLALFCHHVFATGFAKVAHALAMNDQIDLFRRIGLSNIREILLELSMNPAMINWLDNNENIKGEPNENYGRELLELFSMGVGNYTEDDIKNCALAFTGWTYAATRPPLPPRLLLSRIPLPPGGPRLRREDLPRPHRQLQTATTSSTSSSSSRPPPALSPAISTTSSSPTSRRSPPGM